MKHYTTFLFCVIRSTFLLFQRSERPLSFVLSFGLLSTLLFGTISCENKVTPTSSDAYIEKLTLDVAGTDYIVPVSSTTLKASITLAAGVSIPETATVESVELSDGATGVQAGSKLTVASGLISISITAENNRTKKTYEITLVEMAKPKSNDASISKLVLGIAGVDYAITFNTVFEDTVRLPLGTAVPEQVSITEIVFGSSQASAVVTGTDQLVSNTDLLTVQAGDLSITVTSEDGAVTRTHKIYIMETRLSGDTSITDLTLMLAGDNYSVSFANSTSSIALPAGISVPTQASVVEIALGTGARAVVSGTDTEIIQESVLAITRNQISITVIAENAVQKKYVIILSRSVSANAAILDLTLMLDGIEYDVNFTFLVGRISLPMGTVSIPTEATVSSVRLSEGATGIDNADRLAIAQDGTITIMVQSQDADENVYTITVDILQYTEAVILNLVVFQDGVDYNIVFQEQRGTLSLPPFTAMPTQVGVRTVRLSDGATGVEDSDQLPVSQDGVVTINVRSQDGATEMAYSIQIEVEDSAEALITEMTLTVNQMDSDVIFMGQNGTISFLIPFGTPTPQNATIRTVSLSREATGPEVNDQLNIINGVITTTVTAQDGIHTNNYTITVTINKTPNTEARIITFGFLPEHNEDMALESRDRLEIKGDINEATKRISFPTQSAYVYQDALKNPTFTLSEGATVRVTGVEQFPNGKTQNDFTSDISYVVRSQSGVEVTYVVKAIAKETRAVIEDAAFRRYLKGRVPSAFNATDQLDITHASLANVTDIEITTNRNIASVKGIEFFRSLTSLNFRQNQITSLNLSRNTLLEEVLCPFNRRLTSLTLRNNPRLNKLSSYDHLLTDLDLTGIGTPELLLLNTRFPPFFFRTVKVSEAAKDLMQMSTIKTQGGENVTISVWNAAGERTCSDYTPALAPSVGKCNTP